MLYIPITNSNLQKTAEDALKRNEVGILIWATGTRWRHLHDSVKAENPIYQAMMSEVQMGNIVLLNFARDQWRSIEWTARNEGLGILKEDFRTFKDLAAPARNIANDNDYREWVTSICDIYHLTGPITTFPSGHLSSIHFNPNIIK